MKVGDHLWRCRSFVDDDGDVVVLYDEFVVCSETPRGFWIDPYPRPMGRRRWISRTAKHPYVFPTKLAALEDMLRRKRVRNAYLQGEINDNERIIEALEESCDVAQRAGSGLA